MEAAEPAGAAATDGRLVLDLERRDLAPLGTFEGPLEGPLVGALVGTFDAPLVFFDICQPLFLSMGLLYAPNGKHGI